MTPTYTKKRDRHYHYYASMDLIRNRAVPADCGPQRLPAAMVEGAVVAEMRRMIGTPEITARVIAQCEAAGEEIDKTAVIAALSQFDGLWSSLFPAEQKRIVQLIIEKVTVGPSGMTVSIRNQGIGLIARDIAGTHMKGRQS